MDCVLPRLHVVTDGRPGASPLDIVAAAVAAAGRLDAADDLAIQVRVEDGTTDRAAYELTLAVLRLCRPAGVLVLVNDRLHVALAAGADGGHVGADDLPVPAARHVLDAARHAPPPPGVTDRAVRVLGATCREASGALAAVASGADYLGVGPAYGTSTKSGLPDPIGPAGIAAVARAVPGVPVVAIGGVTVQAVPALTAAGAYGVAVVGALSAAADPERAAGELLSALLAAPPRHRRSDGQARSYGQARSDGAARSGGAVSSAGVVVA